MVPLPADGGKTYNFSVIKSDDGTIFPFEVTVAINGQEETSAEESGFAGVVIPISKEEKKAALQKKYKRNPKMTITRADNRGKLTVKFSHKMIIPDKLKPTDHNVLQFILKSREKGRVVGKFFNQKDLNQNQR